MPEPALIGAFVTSWKDSYFQDHTLKKVLLCVIDGWTSRAFVPALEQGRLPNFTRLTRAGYLNPNCISIFPSITPAALASIITGRYPAEHGQAGVYWYDTDTEEVMYFGDDIWVVLKHGMNNFMRDFLAQDGRISLTKMVSYWCCRSDLRALLYPLGALLLVSTMAPAPTANIANASSTTAQVSVSLTI